jgi:hypothetical protein
MTDEQLKNIRNAWRPGSGKTHYPECEKLHYGCAIRLLLEEVDRLRAELPRVRSEAVEEAMRGGFLTCVSGDGKPFVKVEFHELEQAQQLHALLALAPPRSQDERKG